MFDLLGACRTQLADNGWADGELDENLLVRNQVTCRGAQGSDVTRCVATPLGRPLFYGSIRQQGGCLFEVLTEFEGLLGGASRRADEKDCGAFKATLDVLGDSIGLVELVGGWGGRRRLFSAGHEITPVLLSCCRLS
ncbi:hypothetical protein [Rhizobium sp. RU35A]|uniref:hypothetical protein n=1 Tax=Rhizobium sp. RU35A TaxID=1907414 RepID=UPI00122CF9A6|nr:hypothetical protein [Rhizobium sp. RU35A]